MVVGFGMSKEAKKRAMANFNRIFTAFVSLPEIRSGGCLKLLKMKWSSGATKMKREKKLRSEAKLARKSAERVAYFGTYLTRLDS